MANPTDTQRVILSAAAQRTDRLALPLPKRLKGGAAHKVVNALIDRYGHPSEVVVEVVELPGVVVPVAAVVVVLSVPPMPAASASWMAMRVATSWRSQA